MFETLLNLTLVFCLFLLGVGKIYVPIARAKTYKVFKVICLLLASIIFLLMAFELAIGS
jgi:hypothetical protein